MQVESEHLLMDSEVAKQSCITANLYIRKCLKKFVSNEAFEGKTVIVSAGVFEAMALRVSFFQSQSSSVTLGRATCRCFLWTCHIHISNGDESE